MHYLCTANEAPEKLLSDIISAYEAAQKLYLLDFSSVISIKEERRDLVRKSQIRNIKNQINKWNKMSERKNVVHT